MTDQLDLFPTPAPPSKGARRLARRTDPETSKQAAREIAPDLGTLQLWVLGLVRKFPGRTVNELCIAAGVADPRRINRRLSELDKLGAVVRDTPRKCSESGRSCAVWRAK